MRIGSSTNSRTAISTFLDLYPAGDSVFFYRPIVKSYLTSLAVSTNLNSLAYDYHLRNRVGGLNLSEFIMDETSVIGPELIHKHPAVLAFVVRLYFCAPIQSRALSSLLAESEELKEIVRKRSWREQWAVSNHERLRLRSMIDAIYAHFYGLTIQDMFYLVRGCDVPVGRYSEAGFAKVIDPKGFWRIDRDKDPELRHTVLSLIRFKI